MTPERVTSTREITLADGRILPVGTEGDVVGHVNGDLRVRFPLRRVPGAFAEAATVTVGILAVETIDEAEARLRLPAERYHRHGPSTDPVDVERAAMRRELAPMTELERRAQDGDR